MTNFEKIKQMSPEQFVRMFGENAFENVCSQISAVDCCGDCDDCIVNWLKQEAEEC